MTEKDQQNQGDSQKKSFSITKFLGLNKKPKRPRITPYMKQAKVMEILEIVRPNLPEERYQGYYEEAFYGEYELSFEGICDGIDTFEISISQDTYQRFKELGEILGIDPSSWEYVKDHVVEQSSDS